MIMEEQVNTLTLRRVGIDTYRENIIFMRADCNICQAEGFSALTRVIVRCDDKSIIATLNAIHSNILHHGEAFLSEIGFERLDAKDGDIISIAHLPPIHSLSDVRAKMYG